ncbi:hypothetical protein DFJ58DRAFT_688478 [Suillus subalutaceus]|uniref:uncharacterized protein n=1 Tax=Suillus subalutaceus TaxID=48586 RepID=UPI001B8869EA|nr:uncharacterized protein DFJ58DRAFT_688478 [Suillus subalutaceus]KAG1841801.1 hypothetical protein DFJ58DRAFT_688478 [Suillus subalutaceus]
MSPAIIITDSRYVIDGLTKNLKNWEERGWINIANKELFKATAYHLRNRLAPTAFRWVKGHNRIKGNEEADRLAGLGATKDTYDQINTTIPQNFDLQGAKLSKISQALAYKGILASPNPEYKRRTLGLLDMTRHAVHEVSNELETDRTIWLNRKHKDLSKKFQTFTYKALNNAYKVGDFWSQIATLEHRALCPTCKEDVESIEHILTECNNVTVKTIWQLANSLWPEEIAPWPNISIGLILGCGSLKIPHNPDELDPEDNKKAESKRGASRLLRIIISESAYLIWVLRCERVIQEIPQDEEKIKRRWMNAIDKRLQLDRVTASKIKRNKKTYNLVHSTWSKVTAPNKPKNWITSLEVLVGITLHRPPQTEAT